MNANTNAAPVLSARRVGAVLRAAGIPGGRSRTGGQVEIDGKLITASVEVRIAAAIADPAVGRAARAALLQAGYDISGTSNLVCMTVVLPEPVEEIEEPAEAALASGPHAFSAKGSAKASACTSCGRTWAAAAHRAHRAAASA
jgi:hypothetical protein